MVTAPYRKAAAMAAMPDSRQGYGRPASRSSTLSGASLAAGALLMLSGPLSILMGASAIAKDTVLATSLTTPTGST
jgi:hypothetical protein